MAEITGATASYDPVGVSHTELLAALEPLLENLRGPVCIVGGPPGESGAALRSTVMGLAAGPLVVVENQAISNAVDWAETQAGPVSIVVYLVLWRTPGGRKLADCLASLPEGTRLFFVEPTAGVGTAHRLQSWGRTAFLKRLGLGFYVDVPAVLRAAGWPPTSVLRFSVGFPERLMTFVAGEARSAL